jgi:phosphohistidine phosphatase
MKLYLIRHAIAANPDPQAWPDDGERPLTDKGIRRFRRAAEGLGRFADPADVVISSPYRRARETALILQVEAGWPAPIYLDELTGADTASLLSALQAHAAADAIALVGHEPHLSQLAGTLIARGGPAQVELKKGAAACIEVEALALDARGRLLWLLPPRALRAVAKS